MLPFTASQKKQLNDLFKTIKEIKLVYLFGSFATKKNRPNSDIDFAVYIDPRKKDRSFEILLTLSGKIPLIMKTDKIDVLIINTTDNIVLKHHIVREGKLIYEVSRFQLDLELSIVGQYRDFRVMEQQYYKD